MTKSIRISLIVILLSLLITPLHAVTRDELINKCIQAAGVVKNQDLKTAIKQIEDPKGPFIWNNNINYLFLMDIRGKMLAHPFKPELKQSESLIALKDENGTQFVSEFIKVATSPTGTGWVKYMWPLPGETQTIPKYTFIYRIPDTDYFVASGLYVIKAGQYY